MSIAWLPAIIFDSIIFALTLYKRISVGNVLSDGLFSLMIRDGEQDYNI